MGSDRHIDNDESVARYLQTLIKENYDTVYRAIFFRVRNADQAEDLMQDVFVDAFLQINQLKNPWKAKQWLLAIAKNKCAMWRRSQNIRSAIRTKNAENLAFDMVTTIQSTNL